jgi:hypothetical protein
VNGSCSANTKLRPIRFFSPITLAPLQLHSRACTQCSLTRAFVFLNAHTALFHSVLPFCTLFYSPLCFHTHTRRPEHRRQGKQQLTNHLFLLSSADKTPTYQMHTLPQVQGRQGEQLQQPHSLSPTPSQHRTKGSRGPRVVVVSNHRLGFWRQQRPAARATAARKR